MRAVRRAAAAACGMLAMASAVAEPPGVTAPPATAAQAPPTGAAPPANGDAWEFALTAYPTDVRGGERYTSVVGVADHGSLHLEARHNYESVDATSAFVGWTFAGGDTIAWEVRPLLGGAWGSLRALVPAVEASVSAGPFDAYVEAEYVHDHGAHTDSYFYAWSELGYRPVDWLRLGFAGQRTRSYDNDRDYQRGPFVQFSVAKVTVGGYWFNPGSHEQVFVASLGIAF
jgi:hypothetical protein